LFSILLQVIIFREIPNKDSGIINSILSGIDALKLVVVNKAGKFSFTVNALYQL